MYSEFEKQMINESICDECGVEMTENKLDRRKYGKENTYFECDICGNKNRKRTINEIARDCGHIK